MRFIHFLLFCCICLPVALNAKCRALISTAGGINIICDDRSLGILQPGLFEAGWQMGSDLLNHPEDLPTEALQQGMLRAPSGGIVDSEVRVAKAGDGIHISYRLIPRVDLTLNSLHLALRLPLASAIGGQYIADGTAAKFPAKNTNAMLLSKQMKELRLILSDGNQINFNFAQPMPVLLQDDRQWQGAFSIRIGPQNGNATRWPAGKELSIEMTITANGGLPLEFDHPVTISAGKDWLPLDEQLDILAGSALDFSKLISWHEPAGKFGRVITQRDGNFTLAEKPAEPVRFYGVNLCFSGQYLDHTQADRLAQRLKMLGYNAVRLHHYEGLLVDRKNGSSTELNPQRLDQLDYLFMALKSRGIYITTDLYVSRPVFKAEIWPGVTGDIPMDDFKMAIPVNKRAYENYLAFATNLLTHVNPYTKLRYADDSALAWINLINEGNEGNFIGRLQGELLKDWSTAWQQWLQREYPTRAELEKVFGKLPDGNVPLPNKIDNSPAGILLARFLADTDADFVRRTGDWLRQKIGCQALITNLNGWSNPLQNQLTRSTFDYVDDHFYIDHPAFLEKPWSLPSRSANSSPVAEGAPGGRPNAFVRLLDKPFVISEFNYSGPGRFRGVGGMLTSALGALQGWSGIWRFAYSHSSEAVSNPRPISYFDLASDPLNQAAERAAICLFLRGDMSPAAHRLSLAFSREQLTENATTARKISPDWHALAMITQVGTQFITEQANRFPNELLLAIPEDLPDAANIDPYASGAGDKIIVEMRKRGWLSPENRSNLTTGVFQSETEELTIDSPADIMLIDTPRTAGGYAPAGKKITTHAVTINIIDTPAAVWVSSLQGTAIADSSHLLITYLTDLQNSGTKYGENARQTLLQWGSLPHLLQNGRADISLRIKNPENAQVWGLAQNGARLAEITTTIVNGELLIPLDVYNAGKGRMLYEVVIK